MTSALRALDAAVRLPLAKDLAQRAAARWGERRPTIFAGEDPALADALARAVRFAASDAPVLVTGETGTGKELFARAIYLCSPRQGHAFLAVNCAQYQDGQLMASELFGHRKGSFTGAFNDHRGVFEAADGGVVFLDEVGELSLGAQAMLLRVLSEGEVVPVGETESRQVNVRVIAATSRSLDDLARAGRFRLDLLYRLRYLHVRVPAVRERGDDWELLIDYYLRMLVRRHDRVATFASDARELLAGYGWPGNVRELRSVVDTAFHLSGGAVIHATDFSSVLDSLERAGRAEQLRRIPTMHEPGFQTAAPVADEGGAVRDEGKRRMTRMVDDGESFWTVVHRPFLDRELSRPEAQAVITAGLTRTRGSYKRLLPLFHVEDADYLKFMDFLRHQRLKPS